MTVELNTVAKTITVLGQFSFTDIDNIKKMLGEEWSKWTFVQKVTIEQNWTPWYPPYYVQPNHIPIFDPPYKVFCGNNGGTFKLTGDISNIGNSFTTMISEEKV
jgi:hypothetical protein